VGSTVGIGVESPAVVVSDDDVDVDARGREVTSTSSMSVHRRDVGAFGVVVPDSRHSYRRRWLSVAIVA